MVLQNTNIVIYFSYLDSFGVNSRFYSIFASFFE